MRHLLSALLCLCATPALGGEATVKLYKQARPSVVRFFIPDREATDPFVGAGFVIREDGYVVTAAHIANEEKMKKGLTVRLSDGRTFKPELVISDRSVDLALVRIKAGKLPALRLSRRRPEVGADLTVIGHPYGYEFSARVGRVCGLGRDIEMSKAVTLRDCIQTDALINQGDSGGPALNDRGEVEGVMVGLRIEAQGVAFAVPAYKVQALWRRAARGGD